MNHSTKPWSSGKGSVIRRPHFWSIVFLILALATLYYTFDYARPITDYWVPWFWHVKIFEFHYSIHGILFYIPFIYAALIFPWRGVVIVWLVSMALMLPHIISFSFSPASLVVNLLYLLFFLIVVIFIALERGWKERQRQIMAEREAERQTYMSQLIRTQENERQRIAQGLHDDIIQTLLVIANRAQSMLNDKGSKSSPEVREHTESIRDQILQVSEGVRKLSLNLRPSILDNLGLLPALRWLIDQLDSSEAINAQMVIKGVNRELPSESDVIVFRFVQEALNNVRCHSKATYAVVTLEYEPKTVKVTVADNGKGFSLPKTVDSLSKNSKFGIVGMKERAKLLGGNFYIHSQFKKGTSVSIEFRG